MSSGVGIAEPVMLPTIQSLAGESASQEITKGRKYAPAKVVTAKGLYQLG